jgi:hypothetical protein
LVPDQIGDPDHCLGVQQLCMAGKELGLRSLVFQSRQLIQQLVRRSIAVNGIGRGRHRD